MKFNLSNTNYKVYKNVWNVRDQGPAHLDFEQEPQDYCPVCGAHAPSHPNINSQPLLKRPVFNFRYHLPSPVYSPTSFSLLLAQLRISLNQHLVDRQFFSNKGNHKDQLDFASIFIGTIFANIFVFYLIENIGIGLSFVCSYFENEKTEVGYMYQKALGISCFICIAITPIMYLSDRIFRLVGFGNFSVSQTLI